MVQEMCESCKSAEVCCMCDRWRWDYCTQRINYEPKRLTDEVRQEYPWARMFADDIMICRWRKGGGKSGKVIPVIEE